MEIVEVLGDGVGYVGHYRHIQQDVFLLFQILKWSNDLEVEACHVITNYSKPVSLQLLILNIGETGQE